MSTRHYPVDVTCVTPANEMTGEDDAETLELREMLKRAEAYIRGFRWYQPIEESYLGIGIGGVLALFLFRFVRPINGTDRWLWVMEGDLPSAYFVVDEAADPAKALSAYCDLMDEWVLAVRNRQPLAEVFPVNSAATEDNAHLLQTRIEFIRNKILPECRSSASKGRGDSHE